MCFVLYGNYLKSIKMTQVQVQMTTVRVEIFEGGKFRAIPDFALFRKFRGY